MSNKRMFFDIETSFNIGWFWRPGQQYVGPQQIIKERAVICICWKWEGKDKVHSLTWDKEQCDKEMLETFISEMNKAGEIIAHNGDNFDIKWLRTRCLKHRIPMPPVYQTLDTLKIAKSSFNFNSNKLDYISRFLGVGSKTETGGLDLWVDIILDKDKKALKKMVKYCENDVIILEKVFEEIKNYAKHKTHFSVLTGGEKYECPECSSVNVGLSKTSCTAAGTVRRHLKCRECNKNYTVNNKIYTDLLQFKIKNNLK